jgi:hypothetical protein
MKKMRSNHARRVEKMTTKMCLCTAMDVRSYGTPIVSTFRKFRTVIGSVTIVVHSVRSIHDELSQHVLVRSIAGVLEVNSGVNVDVNMHMT